MQTYSNTNSDATSKPVAASPAFVRGDNVSVFTWCPTAQTLTTDSLARNEASRTASTCYMRGLSEHIRIQTNTGVPWFHRRICFTYRGPSNFNTPSPLDLAQVTQYTSFIDPASGPQRLFLNQKINNNTNTTAGQFAILFKGIESVDWTDPIIAPIDTTRVSLKFDKTWTMQSGNANGIVRERKLFHPMNKNLVYDDDENGDVEIGSYFSVDSKAGMGDYYVVDIISPGQAATAADIMLITSNSTLYWHEK